MTEGKIHLCSWVRTPVGYRVWLESDPTVSAEHAEFADADELLYERVMKKTGDGENQHEYAPPRPVAGAGMIDRGRLWLLGRSGRVEISHEPPYFQDGLCEHCLMPLGPRTALPLAVSPLAKLTNATTVRLARAGGGPSLTIISERLLETFTDTERGAFEWRSVTGASKGRVFFEVIPTTPTAPFVGPVGLETEYERCNTCGFVWTAPTAGEGLPDYYVSEADLPRSKQSLLAVKPLPQVALAVTDERWRTLVGKPALKGVQGAAIAIIAAEAVQRPVHFIPRARAKRGW